MRKWVIIIIVAFILLPGAGTLVMLLATPPTEVTQGAPVLLLDEMRVAGEGGTIRAGPGTDHEPIGRFAVGDKLNVTGKAVNGPWFRVKLADGRTGYVPIDRMRTP